MKPEDKQRLWLTIKALAMNAGVANPDKDTARLYYAALQDFTIEQIEISAAKILRTWVYNRMPPVAEFIKNIGEAIPSIESKAVVEADNIISHLHTMGSSGYPSMDDPITKHLMTRRWPYKQWAGAVLTSELQWWKKEFIQSYQAYQDVEVAPMLEAPDKIKQLISGIGGDLN